MKSIMAYNIKIDGRPVPGRHILTSFSQHGADIYKIQDKRAGYFLNTHSYHEVSGSLVGPLYISENDFNLKPRPLYSSLYAAQRITYAVRVEKGLGYSVIMQIEQTYKQLLADESLKFKIVKALNAIAAENEESKKN